MARPDQSMSLLTELQDTALEPAYLEEARDPRPRRPWLFAGTIAVACALLVLAGVGTARSSGDVATEREELLLRIAEAEDGRAELQSEQLELGDEIRALRESQVTDPQLREELIRLGAVAGDVPVTGPGVICDIDDAPNAEGSQGVVFDEDLVRLVNGLWESGAEAVAINGKRLTTQTAIRNAGSAITVDYVSLNPPYVVEAIGDPVSMQNRFARTSAAVWWKFISDNYGISFVLRDAGGDLELPSDPGMAVRYAEA